MKYSTKSYFGSPNLIQSISSDLSKPQGSAFGGNGYYANFNKKTYDQLVKICRVFSMGVAEFEFDSFPETLKALKNYFEQKTLYIGSFKSKSGKKVYYFCHDDFRESVPKALLHWEEENEKDYDKKRTVFPRGRDNYIPAINSEKGFNNEDGWFDVRNFYFFSISQPLTLKIYDFIKNHKGDF